jgi:hypothetical protein
LKKTIFDFLKARLPKAGTEYERLKAFFSNFLLQIFYQWVRFSKILDLSTLSKSLTYQKTKGFLKDRALPLALFARSAKSARGMD